MAIAVVWLGRARCRRSCRLAHKDVTDQPKHSATVHITCLRPCEDIAIGHHVSVEMPHGCNPRSNCKTPSTRARKITIRQQCCGDGAVPRTACREQRTTWAMVTIASCCLDAYAPVRPLGASARASSSAGTSCAGWGGAGGRVYGAFDASGFSSNAERTNQQRTRVLRP
jgi:hypothetical protein